MLNVFANVASTLSRATTTQASSPEANAMPPPLRRMAAFTTASGAFSGYVLESAVRAHKTFATLFAERVVPSLKAASNAVWDVLAIACLAMAGRTKAAAAPAPAPDEPELKAKSN